MKSHYKTNIPISYIVVTYSSKVCNHQHNWNHIKKPYKIIFILYIYFLDYIITIMVKIVQKNGYKIYKHI